MASASLGPHVCGHELQLCFHAGSDSSGVRLTIVQGMLRLQAIAEEDELELCPMDGTRVYLPAWKG